MRDHCRHYPDDSPKVRLKLAQVLIRNATARSPPCERSRRSPPGRSPRTWKRARRKLVLQAERMREEGVIEVEEEDG